MRAKVSLENVCFERNQYTTICFYIKQKPQTPLKLALCFRLFYDNLFFETKLWNNDDTDELETLISSRLQDILEYEYWHTVYII